VTVFVHIRHYIIAIINPLQIPEFFTLDTGSLCRFIIYTIWFCLNLSNRITRNFLFNGSLRVVGFNGLFGDFGWFDNFLCNGRFIIIDEIKLFGTFFQIGSFLPGLI
jgi:hypothetical protein